MSDSPIIVEPNNTATACVIWLHGLGADGHDFLPILPQLNLPPDHGIRFVFPHAPVRPVSLNAGMPMRAWFDIKHASSSERYELAELEAAEQDLHALIEAQQLPSERIVLVGFSQGGALALFTGCRYPQKLAGLAGLSAFLPHAECIKPATNEPLQIFMGHGTADEMVRFEWGEMSAARLRELGHQVTWQAYPMAHHVCSEEIADFSRFLQHVVG